MIDLGPTANRLGDLIASVNENDLLRETPCGGYRVGDLLDHIGGVTLAFGGAAMKATGPSSMMGPAGDASNLPNDWRDRLPGRVRGLADDWLDPEAWNGITRVGGGELPAETAGIITLGELAVHGWDLATATGRNFAPDASAVEPLYGLVSQVFGPGNDAARGAAFGPAVPVSEDAPLFNQVLGLLGRDPTWSAAASR
jgi:uncharacterized protein (TIGR03086 family)